MAGAYFKIGEIVGLDRLRGLALRINAAEHWDRLAIRRIVDDLRLQGQQESQAALAQWSGV